ncbi:8-amino-7-oxononanoate synthase [Maridesulfovibrio ferrireducens]|uniref:aminotransferase class I/II-fold pyridoxal phosphate-dependent enzyme n=1 Tax=Maridesulfovibrio ferrireducens TaxID=246191 RepID=UPI001A1EA774|nr:8-amino-7-oxononanoate synthase [Maridesulfovibrio ferrireducens]MBI9110642.1 8-amino-7-oxononanoate synthase [Maridesulfovibrio ferrireducens]
MTSKWFYHQIKTELAELEEASLLRRIPAVDNGAEKELLFKGQKFLNLASNDYLGLACDERLKLASIQAVRDYGTGSAASRLVTGNFKLYDTLEQEFAAFKEQEDAMLFSSGYAANLAIMDSFADRHSVIFSDKLNHASIIDGIKMSGAKHVRYQHNDIEHLKKRLESFKNISAKILITDTIFSMDGDLAHIEEIAQLCEFYDVMLVVDEAHAEGIFGGGKGLCFERKISKLVDLHMGAFSKGFGSLGGIVSGSSDLISFLRNKGRSFVFSTALPPAVVGANLASLRLVLSDPSIGEKLLDKSLDLKRFLESEGFDCGNSESQIIPVILGENKLALQAQAFLLEAGIYTAAIRPPTVPMNTARLRLSLRADLTSDDIEKIKHAFALLKKEIL